MASSGKLKPASARARLPLNSLRVFEAVATRKSFADAAEALNVTPAAVSQQIANLEDYLQIELFRRTGRRIELTAEALELLPGVRRGLDQLESTLQHVRQNRASGPLQVTLLSSFLQRWLLPRIRSLRRRHPEIGVRFHTSREPVDFARMPIHVAIRFGKGGYEGLYHEKLIDEWVVPVAAPEVLKQYGALKRGTSLARYPLLEGSDEPWRIWSQIDEEEPWRGRAPTIDDSGGLLAAAEEGLGYALARWTLVAASVQRGTLRLAGTESLPYNWAYWFVCPEPYLTMPKVIHFRDWLRERAAEFPSPAST
jgi:LysR family glycine cleavage system transcriptional activator